MVFGNLMINAAKAMKNTGTLTVTTEVDADGNAQIRFLDTGPGLPPAIVDRIFDPFFTTGQGQGGTGPGLAICRETVGPCGGTIAAANAPEGGAVFTVRLPQLELAEALSH